MTSGTGTASFAPNSNDPNAIATVTTFGAKEFTWTEVNGTCSSAAVITVNYQLPVANAGSGGNECDLNFQLQATLSVGTGTWSKITGPGGAVFSPSPNDPRAKVTVNEYGAYDFIWTESNGSCSGSSSVTVTFWEQPSAYAGPDQILEYQFEATLDADIPVAGKGTWKVTDGKATIFNLNDPKSSVSGLAQGNNIFTWQVTNGICNVASDDIEITVNDIITPTVITPNDDGLNDELIFPGIDAFPGSSITIYNRWGSEVYRNADYKNDWKGKDQKRRDLEIDTYYYILKISNGRTIKGFVEIRR